MQLRMTLLWLFVSNSFIRFYYQKTLRRHAASHAEAIFRAAARILRMISATWLDAGVGCYAGGSRRARRVIALLIAMAWHFR